MEACETTDFIFPLKADIYYPIITQNQYGQPNKAWVFDRTIAINTNSSGGQGTEDIKAAEFLQNENKLIGRSRSDIRISSNNSNNAITNILITNIRSSDNSLIYKETAGPRNGKGTIYEIATVDPFVGPFGSIEYFKILLRRTENQTVGD